MLGVVYAFVPGIHERSACWMLPYVVQVAACVALLPGAYHMFLITLLYKFNAEKGG